MVLLSYLLSSHLESDGSIQKWWDTAVNARRHSNQEECYQIITPLCLSGGSETSALCYIQFNASREVAIICR